MNITRLRLRDFRSYRNLDLTFTDGACAVIGPNGSGKSTLLVGIDIGLFGTRSLEPFLSYLGGTNLLVQVEVLHGGERYRVRRSYSRGKSALDFEVCASTTGAGDAHTWEPLTLASMKETQALIESTFDLPAREPGAKNHPARDVIRASAFIGQKDADVLTAANPAERMRTLRATVGDLDRYQRAHANVKADRRRMEGESARLDGVIAGLEQTTGRRGTLEEMLAVLADEAERMLAALTAAEETLDQARGAYEQGKEQHAGIGTLQAEARTAAERLAGLEREMGAAQQAKEMLDAERQREASLTASVAKLPGLVDAEAELAGRVAEHGRLVSEHAAAVQARDHATGEKTRLNRQAAEFQARTVAARDQADRLEQAGPGENVCDACNQTLGAEALASRVAKLRVDADEYEAAILDLVAAADAITIPDVHEPPAGEPPTYEHRDARQALELARSAERALAMLRGRLEQLVVTAALADNDNAWAAIRDAREASETAASAHRAATATAPNLDTLQNASIAALEAVGSARGNLERVRQQQAVTRADLERVTAADRELAKARAEHESLDEEIGHLFYLERAFGPQGIPLLVVENAVPAIEAAANDMLRALGSKTAGATIQLRTQKTIGTGEARDTLDIVIVTSGGHELPYEHWSGGEQYRIDLALRYGLSRVLRDSGARVENLFIDEPSGLDADGQDAFVAFVDAVIAAGEFRSVVVVSHDDRIRESFAQVIEVDGADGRPSRIVGADVEAMAVVPQ